VRGLEILMLRLILIDANVDAGGDDEDLGRSCEVVTVYCISD
jgi:hypothetical protein